MRLLQKLYSETFPNLKLTIYLTFEIIMNMTEKLTSTAIPRLSVIIPAYNCPEYLITCMESLLNQTYEDLEVIIVDDCSTDDGKTFSMAKSYEESDSRVKAVRAPQNGGCGMARNYGLQFAKGDYVAFVDADDTMDKTAFEEMMHCAVKFDADIVRCKYDCVHENGKVTGSVFTGEPELYEDPSDIRNIAICLFSPPASPKEKNFDFGGSAWAALYRRSIVMEHNIRFPNVAHFLSEDYPFSFRFMDYVKHYVRIPRTYYHYRLIEGSMTKDSARLDMVQRVVKSAEYFEKLVKQHPGCTEDDINHARGYIVASLRGYLKVMFMSRAFSFREKRKWFRKQQDYPMMKVCYESYPWRKLRFKHRLSFWAFYKKHFLLLYTLIVGQEKVRKLLGKI